jgi:hypothetical protein
MFFGRIQATKLRPNYIGISHLANVATCSRITLCPISFKIHFKIHLNSSLYWLIDCLRFYVPLKNISLIWGRHHCRWRAAKFRPMLSAQGLWARRDLYHATPAVTRDLGFSGLIRGTALFNRLLRHTRGCWGYIVTLINKGLSYIVRSSISYAVFIWCKSIC